MATALITGCNSGFGRAAALAFARRGDKVFGTVRSAQRGEALLREAAEENLDLRTLVMDVTRTEDFPRVIQQVVNEGDSIDVLVNNAGILRPGAWEDLDEATIREVMETNFFGPMLLARSALPHMREQGGGCIIMISSLSGLAGLAGDVAYSASKFALEGATEALRHEVDRWGIRVALVEAGQYATDLDAQAKDLGAEGLSLFEFSRHIGIVENQRVQIAVAGVKDVGHLEPVVLRQVPHAVQHDGQ